MKSKQELIRKGRRQSVQRSHKRWVFCSDSTGKYLRSDVHPMRWVDDPNDATQFDERDNREIKSRVLGAISGHKLVALDI